MASEHGENAFLGALKRRKSQASRIFVALMLVASATALFMRQYTASAAIALNPAIQERSGPDAPSTVEIAWSALTDRRIEELIRRYGLDTGFVQLLSQDHAFTYLRSKISLRRIDPTDAGSMEIEVSFTGQKASAAVGMANAVAGILAGIQAPLAHSVPSSGSLPSGSAPSPSSSLSTEIDKTRSELAMLAGGQKQGNLPGEREEVQKRLQEDANLQAEEDADAAKLISLEQRRQALWQDSLPAMPASRPAPSPARAALLRQIAALQAHLSELRQRYTDQYPDVIDAKSALVSLEAKLAAMPAESGPRAPANRPPSQAALNEIASQEAQIRADQAHLQSEMQVNREQAETLRNRMSDTQTVAQDYAELQNKYQYLLQQRAARNAAPAIVAPSAPGAAPMFLIVKTAQDAAAAGLATDALYWPVSGLCALAAAALWIFLAEWSSPTFDDEPPRRNLHPSER